MTGSDLDAQVRAADPDRWASSRFVADPRARADLVSLYAFEAELSAIPARVSQPLLAEMRYAWWREQMDGVFTGAPRKGHPVLEGLAAAVANAGLPGEPFDALIQAHIERAHGREHDLGALFEGPAQLGARILSGERGFDAAGLAGRLYGLVCVGRHDEAVALRPHVNRALSDLPMSAFPAIAHAALRAWDEPEFLKRLRLTWAVLRGRV